MTTYDATQYVKTLTNLLTYGDFEGSGWSGGSYDTGKHHTGTRSYKMVGSTSSAEVLANHSGNISVNNTHLYYVRWWVYHEGAPGSTGCYFGIAEPSFIEGLPLGPANQWNMKSHINNRASFSGSQGFRFDYNNGNQAGTVWFDSGMVIDLTDSFGAGNEPDLSWCDENIPDFVGTTSITLDMPALKAGDIVNIPYTGSAVQIPLKRGTYNLKVWGAQGGYRSSSTYGGKGGVATGVVTFEKNVVLHAYAGGAGNTGKTSGGFNGGGRRYSYNGGGGASDFRVDSDSLYARIIVAGGGGSDGSTSRGGGVGGGTQGGSYSGSGYGTNNGPGKETYSGSSTSTTADEQSTGTTSSTDIYGGFGFGGNGCFRSSGYGGAGGGGWYGGSGTYPDSSGDDDKAGCGGSAYAWQSSTKSQYPSGCLLDDSMFMTDVYIKDGSLSFESPSGGNETGHSGNGHCRITVVEIAGFTASWVADVVTVREDLLDEGAVLTPPDVSKVGYTTTWTVNGQTVDLSTYRMPASDIELVAVYVPDEYTILYYDNGNVSTQKAQYDTVVSLPAGGDATRRFAGWYYNGQTITSLVMPAGDVTLLARYDESSARIDIDLIGVQPNPSEVGETMLVTVNAHVTETSVPRWTDMAISADDGLPMSSPYQVQIWDTSDNDPMATFEADGIKTAGMDVPPIEAIDVPMPRIGIWSADISDENGSCDFTIHGSGSASYTSSIIIYSSEEVHISEAEITYINGTSRVTERGTSGTRKLTFPSGTYMSFDIRVLRISKPYSHVRILNVAPGGA